VEISSELYKMQQLIFILVAGAAFGLFYKQIMRLRRNILLGKEEDITGDAAERWKNVALIAFGQKKMFKNWIPAIFHLFIYVAFLFTQVELIEILTDGIFGIHRFFANKIGFLYPVIINTIEILSFLALVSTFVFLYRRNIMSIARFKKPELEGWPTREFYWLQPFLA
jgi:hypothetical protein